MLDKFVEAGGNFIDTADVYQFGVSESIIGMKLQWENVTRSWVLEKERIEGMIVILPIVQFNIVLVTASLPNPTFSIVLSERGFPLLVTL